MSHPSSSDPSAVDWNKQPTRDIGPKPIHPWLSDEVFPQPFGRYSLRRRLGAGGMGTVYLADDTRLDIEVALKFPHQALLCHADVLPRFYREARAAARVHHPNLCRIFDVGEIDGLHYLSMRYIDGQPLHAAPQTPPEAIAGVVSQLARAMAAAHDRGVIHRDLKPGNILVTAEGEPVITDFGLARVVVGPGGTPSEDALRLGTPAYMSPEQITGDDDEQGPAADIYSLGVIFFELLTGQRPFHGPGMMRLILMEPAPLPSSLRPGLDKRYDDVCRQALAKEPADRFADMRAFAQVLTELAGGDSAAARPWPPTHRGPSAAIDRVSGGTARPLIHPEVIGFAFVGMGEKAPDFARAPDRLFLDVGNALRPGVIDHHQQEATSGSTTQLVLTRADLLDASVAPGRPPDAPFTLVLHVHPDIDCLASAYLASEYLIHGRFPDEAAALARYVNKIDEGLMGQSLADPFSLYAAWQLLGRRLDRRADLAEEQRWQEQVRQGLDVVAFALAATARDGLPLPAVDAFACPGRFTDEDRRDIEADIERYARKLADPRCQARRARLRLASQFGGKAIVEALLVRDVQNPSDPERCLFFKDWARTDAQRCRNRRGFVALSVFHSEGPGQLRRCILSVHPENGVTLEGLAALLDAAEAKRRQQVHGMDDRVIDPATRIKRPPRPGYDNADPWYDGRAHGYTIVDSPRGGTLLRAEEIEALLLQFGDGRGEVGPLA